MDSQKGSVTPICIRPTSAQQRAAWEPAAADASETVSDLVRGAVDAELERREETRELEEKRRVSDPYGFGDILRRPGSRTPR